MSEKLTIKPYARLITMLGEQLIKNEMIALVELIKNSYDADAEWVKVSFIGFNDDFSLRPESRIIIEDDGCSMDETILKKHWLNPATPDKLKRKAQNARTQKGRILQGEKGIGRFAIFKLGKTIKITSRRQEKNSNGYFIDSGSPIEHTLLYDFTKYDDNFLTENGEEKELYLENLVVELTNEPPKKIIPSSIILGTTKRTRKPHGTIIEISNLKSSWSLLNLERIQNEIGKMQPIFSKDDTADFSVWLYRNEQLHTPENSYKDTLIKCLDDKSVFKVTNGKFIGEDEETVTEIVNGIPIAKKNIVQRNLIEFNLNGQQISLDFNDPDINGLTQFKKFGT